ncbi:hypothetical protein N7373_21900 [Achromobacter mucicolens]|uniref:hypothetical protein n=1 Tax=Achromobacter mucicolens TaxID=1389922 RepID=UPI0024481588|nr:hypothetical protein [Achromobacter mucicolens]MDH0094108.1 hypothetical protein [Achromobacter mucicolens]
MSRRPGFRPGELDATKPAPSQCLIATFVDIPGRLKSQFAWPDVPLHACTPRFLTRVTRCAHAARRQTHEAPLNALHGALVDRKARPRWRAARHRVTRGARSYPAPQL